MYTPDVPAAVTVTGAVKLEMSVLGNFLVAMRVKVNAQFITPLKSNATEGLPQPNYIIILFIKL